jgi:hypothetical protein
MFMPVQQQQPMMMQPMMMQPLMMVPEGQEIVLDKKPYGRILLWIGWGLILVGTVGVILLAVLTGEVWTLVFFAVFLIASIVIWMGLYINHPGYALVLTEDGFYKGTIKTNGRFWIDPFKFKHPVSLKAETHLSHVTKVHDKDGNSIEARAAIVYCVEDTYKCMFAVSNYVTFVHHQSEAAVRQICAMYPYDAHGDAAVLTLKSGSD